MPLTQENSKESIEQADLVVEGEYMMNIGPDKKENLRKDKEGEGFTILFKVTKRYKGKVKGDTLAIYQTSNSCTRIFRKGERYILLVKEIDGFQLSHDQKQSNGSSKLQKEGGLSVSITDKKTLRYWKGIHRKYLVADIKLCSSFRKGTEEAELLQRQF
ncbi:hypothetical protein GCM10028791_36420 [Echinicola sediminis]